MYQYQYSKWVVNRSLETHAAQSNIVLLFQLGQQQCISFKDLKQGSMKKIKSIELWQIQENQTGKRQIQAYVVTSRPRTIGNPTVDNPHPIDSALYFDCPIGTKRFEKVLFKDNGERTLMVEKRERWAKHLEHHKLRTDEIYNEEKVLSMTENVKEKMRTSNDNNTKGDLNLKIITMITNPNEQWKLKREKYLVCER